MKKKLRFTSKQCCLLKYTLALLTFVSIPFLSISQQLYFFQGFESTGVCPENWGYAGGEVNSTLASEGNNSLRIGGVGNANTVTFAAVDVSEITNGVISVQHAVLDGNGPGLDTREGAAFYISLDGGSYFFVSGVGGFGDHSYDWSESSGGATQSTAGCQIYQTPNPFEYAIPTGTNTVSLRVISVVGNNCGNYNFNMENGVAGNYNRADENFYIDNVTISGDEPVFDVETLYCQGAMIPSLPATSDNNINGSWTPALNNQSTTIYAFTPDFNLCPASSLTITITPQPAQPSLACYETATFNTETCEWEISGTQPSVPTDLACYETAIFNTSTCEWDVTGSQPTQPTLACYETATFNTVTCEWEISGTQPSAPTDLACYETAVFNTSTCDWDVTGSQPTQPTLACYEAATFNAVTCEWEISGTQPSAPTDLACYETAVFNTSTCDWDVTGSQPTQPTLACYETATFNTETCQWEISGTQPNQPALACYESANFNTTSCEWEVTGVQPDPPTELACYETTIFNSDLCEWEIIGEQPSMPSIACYETANFDTAICEWVVSGEPITYEESQTICSNQLPFSWYGIEFTEAGSTTFIEQTADDCDSTVTLNLEVVLAPEFTPISGNQTHCDEFTLPEIEGTDLNNPLYYLEPAGNGVAFQSGATFSFEDFSAYPVTFFIYDTALELPNCSSEEIFNLRIIPSPILEEIEDITGCESAILPEIIGENLNFPAYYTEPNGLGLTFEAGASVTPSDFGSSSVTLYVFDESNTNPNCFSEVSFNLTINTIPTIGIEQGGGIYCDYETPDEIIVSVVGAPVFELNYLFNGEQSSVISAGTTINIGNEAGTYELIAISDENCTDSLGIDLEIVITESPAVPTVSLPEQFCTGSEFEPIMATGTGDSLFWFTDEDAQELFSEDAAIIPDDNIGITSYYVLEIVEGCESELVQVDVNVEVCEISVSEGISPNGDGINDFFTIENVEAFPNTKLTIINRWGTEIYHSEDYQNDWNGTSQSKYNVGGNELPEGTYYYLIELGENPSVNNLSTSIYKGWFYLRR